MANTNPYESLRIPISKSCVDVIIPVPKELRIREELIGPHCLNSNIQHNSSPRGYMYTNHQSQSVTLINGDGPILQTGVDNQLARHTFGPVLQDGGIVMRVIPRYGNLSADLVTDTIDTLVFFLTEEPDDTGRGFTRTLDYTIIPKYHTGLHQNFGFEYKTDPNVLKQVKRGNYIQPGTRLAVSPSIRENSEYALGVNANMLLCSHPDIAEDGIVISESLAKKMRYHVFETKAVEFGSDYLPLNLYGDDNNYKPFPEIGDKINQSSVLAALRNFSDFNSNKAGLDNDPLDFTMALMSNADLRRFDTVFDKCIYVRGPGETLKFGNIEEDSGVVIDIVCYKNNKKTSELYQGLDKIAEKYANSYIKYNEDILDAFDSIMQELQCVTYGYGTNDIKITHKLHTLIVQAGKVAYEKNMKRIKSNPKLMEISHMLKRIKDSTINNLPSKLALSNRSDNIDTYRFEFTIRYTVVLDKGHKLSDQSGGKGVIIDVRPDHLMPYNKYGRADIVMDSNSIISRMNLARLYQQFFSGASRKTKVMLRNILNTDNVHSLDMKQPINIENVENAFRCVMGLLGKFDTYQFDTYGQATLEEKLEILQECIQDEVKIQHQVSTEKRAYQIAMDIINSEYDPPVDYVSIPYVESDGTIKEFKTKTKLLIAPLYTILISKTADNMLYTSSPNLNNFMFPIPVTSSNRDRFPYRNTPVKNISETEGRLFSFYGGREAIAELKDRANSVPTHRALYNNILTAQHPTNVDNLVDRNLVPFGNDSAIKLVQSIFNSIGMSYTYVPGRY